MGIVNRFDNDLTEDEEDDLYAALDTPVTIMRGDRSPSAAKTPLPAKAPAQPPEE